FYIVDQKVGRIDDDILLTIKDDILREKLLNVNLLIAKIDSLRDNPTPSSEVVIKSTSTFPNLFLEETNTFDNSIPESETFRFNLEEISSGSPTTRSDLSLPDYKAFYVDNDHFKEKSSGSTTTHVDFSQYDSFIFDLSNDQFPPADRSDLYHEEFADELTHIMSLPNLECFKFKVDPDPGNLTLMLYGSFLLFLRISLSLHIFSPPGMKIPFLIPASQSHESDPDLFTSINVEDETLGGSFHTTPPRSTQIPLVGPTSGGAEDLATLTALSSLVSELVQKVSTLESELKAHKLLFMDVVPKLVKKVKALKVKIQTKKRKVVLSDSDQEDGGEPDVNLDALNALANAAVTVDSTKSPSGPSKNPAACSYDPSSDVPTTEVPSTEFPTDVPSDGAPTGP
ncbi:hypothetical protein Tco_0897200, partial [Tanacetum coccineum]